jgi:hypothetical protein
LGIFKQPGERIDRMTTASPFYQTALNVGLKRKWHLMDAKVRVSQSLLVHSLNVVSNTQTLLDLTGRRDQHQVTAALGAAFVHDAGKATPQAQQVLSQGKGEFRHKDSGAVSDEDLRALLSELGISDLATQKESIAVARAMERLESTTHLTDVLKAPPHQPDLIDLVMLADELASLHELLQPRISIEGN